MLNLTIRPNGSPQEEAGVFALIALVMDPASCQERLDALRAARDEAQTALTASEAAAVDLAATQRDIADREATIGPREEQLRAVMTAFSQERDQKTRALSQFSAQLDQLEKDLATRESGLADKASTLDRREAALKARETAAAQTEAATLERQNDTNARTAALDERENNLKTREVRVDRARAALAG